MSYPIVLKLKQNKLSTYFGNLAHEYHIKNVAPDIKKVFATKMTWINIIYPENETVHFESYEI